MMPSETPAPGGWRPPRFGKYELAAPATIALGRTRVYKAVDTQRRRTVALKLLPADFGTNLARREACQRNAGLAARIRDNSILTIHELSQVNGTWFLTLELLECGDLQDHVERKGPLPAEEALRFLAQAGRALALAHKGKLALPILCPASFLVVRQHEQTSFKLIPLDVLRESWAQGMQPKAELSYQAPEVVQHPRARDIRSALYSLGGTVLFMLTGRPPAVRDAQTWAAVRARLPGPLLAILQSLLAADPNDRYPTPEALLEDLDRSAHPEKKAARAAAPPRPRHPEEKQMIRHREASLRAGVSRLAILVMAAVIVGMGVAMAVLWQRLHDAETASTATDTAAKKTPEDGSDGDSKEPEPPAVIPWLYPGAANVQKEDVLKQFEGPFARPFADPKGAAVFTVGRVAPLMPGARKGATFPTLAEACAAAPAGKVTIIQIFDNGPLCEGPITVTDRSLVVAPGPGCRPLLVWDVSKGTRPAEGELATFLSVERGSLQLWNLDLAVEWPGAGPACLVRVASGEFYGMGCTFSASTNGKGGVTLVRLESDGKEAQRCRLSHCFGRGGGLTAVDVRAPGAQVMVDECLLAGGDQPLLRCQAGGAGAIAPVVRVIRSTLTAEKVLLQIRPGSGALTKPALEWMGWDALLARRGKNAGGVLVALPEDAAPGDLKWRAVNCLYVGWKHLLTGRAPIAATDESAWRKRWQLPEGDKIMPDPVPLAYADPGVGAFPLDFNPDGTLYAFPATFSEGRLGCDLTKLPGARTNWRDLAYRRVKLPEAELLKGEPPPIPKIEDGRYYGGRIDLSKTDLAAHLKEIQKKQPLGAVVTLHLTGSGPHKVSPVLVENASLWLYFEQPGEGHDPLVLIPEGKPAPGQTAVFQVKNGNLYVVGGAIRCPDDPAAPLPHYLVHVSDGNLLMHGTRLYGPLTQPPAAHWGLIRLDGSGRAAPDEVYACTLHETVLVSARMALHVVGAGARVRLQHCVIATGKDALHFQPALATPDRLNVQCSLEHCTVAARRAVVYTEDVPASGAPINDPILVQSQASAFLNPYVGTDRTTPEPAGVLVCQGLALPRGVLAWQGDGDVFDRRLFTYVSLARADGQLLKAGKPQPFSLWQRLWGPIGSRGAVLDVPFTAPFILERPILTQLQVPAHPSLGKATPGADLKRLMKLGGAGPP
jgi:hypothetical protein